MEATLAAWLGVTARLAILIVQPVTGRSMARGSPCGSPPPAEGSMASTQSLARHRLYGTPLSVGAIFIYLLYYFFFFC